VVLAIANGSQVGTRIEDNYMPATLIVALIGFLGLLLMAIPGLSGHGHGAIHVSTHGPLNTHATLHGASHSHSIPVAKNAPAPTLTPLTFLRWFPSPRVVFSLLTMAGCIGYTLEGTLHIGPGLALLVALVPAIALEKLLFTPLWNKMLQFEGKPSSPLEALTMQEATAVTPFRNGRGIVSVDRDGREVQFRASLEQDQLSESRFIKVGDRMVILQVDAAKERVVVSLHK
jgi:hypothetical protein